MAVNGAEGQKPSAVGYIRLLSVLPSGNSFILLNAQRRQPLYNSHRFQVQADDLADQARDIVRVAGAVGVVDDAAAGVGFDAVLVDDPFEGGAVAEAVGEGGGGDAVEGGCLTG